jgi:hypothetical protein
MHRWGRIHFGGPSVLYLLRRACTVTPYVSPDHLAAFWEAEAIGAPPPAAVATTAAESLTRRLFEPLLLAAGRLRA